MLQQYPSENLMQMLNEPHHIVQKAIKILLEAKDLRQMDESNHLMVTHGFAVAFELVRLLSNSPLARMYVVISNYHVLGLMLKDKAQWLVVNPERALTEQDVSRVSVLCMQQALFNLSVYGVHAQNIDNILPAFLNLAPLSPKAKKAQNKLQAVEQLLSELEVQDRGMRYHPQLRYHTSRVSVEHLKSYWTVAVALEGLLRAKNLAYSDPECSTEDPLEMWLSAWSLCIPDNCVIMAVDEYRQEELSGKYFLIVNPVTASEIRLLFGRYGASERVHVWNHGANF
ncbi:MAG: hypothetical protein J6S69_09140 [Proteobacteria bacterium]|nr:hypothetical protein [Pseudomonadota bacterium]